MSLGQISNEVKKYMGFPKFENLKGLTLSSVNGMEVDSECITFKTECGREFRLHHSQDCCESVSVESVVGDVADLIGAELLIAEEVEGETPSDFDKSVHESFTWTFYKLATRKGYVDLRWFGESNGYYCETASFDEIEK